MPKFSRSKRKWIKKLKKIINYHHLSKSIMIIKEAPRPTA